VPLLGTPTPEIGSPRFPEAFELAHLHVLERIAAGEPLPDLLDRIVRLVEAQSRGMLCSILYHPIMQAASDGVWLLDARGATTLVSDGRARMLGHASDELAREVKSTRPGLPVALLSGNVHPEDQRLAEALGVEEIGLKPDTDCAMGQLLHRLLAR
jgi:PAS domain-containing protein